jgi:hypothetical protein
MGNLVPVMFTLVPLFIMGVFVMLIGTFVVRAFQVVTRWQENNSEPILTVPARVATKRFQVVGAGSDSMVGTWYYITFEAMPDGLRQEFAVNPRDYSGLAEGDVGQLTYQGTRFQSFARSRPAAPPPPVPPSPDWICSYCRGHVPAAETKCPSCGSTCRLEPVGT